MTERRLELRELYSAAYPRLVQTLTLAAGSRDEAEEVTQEAFVRALDHWRSVRVLADPEAWIRKVAFRLLSNRRRKLLNGARAMLRHPPTTPISPPDPLSVDLGRALALISTKQRHALLLHYVVGLNLTEVAAELGVPVGTVKSRLNRGRAALAPLLREECPSG